MLLNTTINILGGLPDWNLVIHLLADRRGGLDGANNFQSYTSLKTTRSVERFERAIRETLIRFHREETEHLLSPPLLKGGISPETRLLLFWNASYNNDLLGYLRSYSGQQSAQWRSGARQSAQFSGYAPQSNHRVGLSRYRSGEFCAVTIRQNTRRAKRSKASQSNASQHCI